MPLEENKGEGCRLKAQTAFLLAFLVPVWIRRRKEGRKEGGEGGREEGGREEGRKGNYRVISLCQVVC